MVGAHLKHMFKSLCINFMLPLKIKLCISRKHIYVRNNIYCFTFTDREVLQECTVLMEVKTKYCKRKQIKTAG